MLLTPTELERLTIYTAAELARKRKAKGLKLNHPEATAIIADEILEGAREGRSVADLIRLRIDHPHQRRRDARRRRADADAPGGGHFPGRHQAGHVHEPIRPGKQAAATRRCRARRNHCRGRRYRDQCRAPQGDGQSRQHRRPSDSGRQPLSTSSK